MYSDVGPPLSCQLKPGLELRNIKKWTHYTYTGENKYTGLVNIYGVNQQTHLI